MQGEIRQNMATSQWVMYDPGHSKPWQEGLHQYHVKTTVPVQDPTCPFCPGSTQYVPHFDAGG
jgi:galactose-1-phosphate uridylyltransferase